MYVSAACLYRSFPYRVVSNTWCEQVQLGAGGFARQILRPINPDAAVNKMLTKGKKQTKQIPVQWSLLGNLDILATYSFDDRRPPDSIEQGGFARQILLAAVNTMLLKGKTDKTNTCPVATSWILGLLLMLLIQSHSGLLQISNR